MLRYCDLHYTEYKGASHQYEQESSTILLFIHPNSASSRWWESTIQEINKLDKTITQFTIDLRGMGKSQQLKHVVSIQDFAQDIKQLAISTLKLSDDQLASKLIIVGWQLGGAIALQMASQWPNLFRRLILINTIGLEGLSVMKLDAGGRYTLQKCESKDEVASRSKLGFMEDFISNKYLDGIKHFQKQLSCSNHTTDTEWDQICKETLLQTNYYDVQWAMHTFNFSQTQAQNIIGPVLVIHGSKDVIVSEADAQQVMNRLGQSKCRLIIKEDLGSLLPLDDPQFLASEIKRFIIQNK